jgi:predicted ABC-type ATPase
MPEAVILGGANGAGKTTFARHFVPLAFPNAAFLNADEIQREGDALGSPLAAGRELMRRLDDAVATGRDFAVETTLSSSQYARRMPAWRTRGYTITLIFLEVPDPDFAVARVALRVAMGGHNIPEEDVRRRYARGKALFESVYRSLADVWYWYKWNGEAYEIHQHSSNTPQPGGD